MEEREQEQWVGSEKPLGRELFSSTKKTVAKISFFFFFLMPQLLLLVYGKRESASTGNQQNQMQTIAKQESLLIKYIGDNHKSNLLVPQGDKRSLKFSVLLYKLV